jgi:hypothetical protein
MDVMSLTPEERAALRAALDQAEEKDPVEQLAEVVEYLCKELDAVKKAHDALKGLVMEDLIGGIKEAYEGNVRSERMNDFKGKYGSMLDPLAEPFKKTFNADLHDKAFDYMDQLRGEEGYTDEVGDSKLKEVIQQIKEKLGLNESAPVAAVVTEEVKPAEEGKAEEEPEDDAQKAWDEIAQMKSRDDAREAARDKSRARKGA